ncbi:MAG: addiction module protein [Desulfuromusa sp.]|nr:addiction module protein [Desulfuromusa sp.]
MATSQKRLFKEALDLTEKDRAKLAGLLIGSLDAEEGEGVEAAWISEVEGRLAALDKGHTKTIPWEEVKKQLLKNLNVRNDHTISSRGSKGS